MRIRTAVATLVLAAAAVLGAAASATAQGGSGNGRPDLLSSLNLCAPQVNTLALPVLAPNSEPLCL